MSNHINLIIAYDCEIFISITTKVDLDLMHVVHVVC